MFGLGGKGRLFGKFEKIWKKSFEIGIEEVVVDGGFPFL